MFGQNPIRKNIRIFLYFLCITFCWGFQIDKSNQKKKKKKKKRETEKRKKTNKNKKEKNVNLMLILALNSFRAVNSYLTALIFLFLEKNGGALQVL